jgi:hypothetical protein
MDEMKLDAKALLTQERFMLIEYAAKSNVLMSNLRCTGSL